MRRDSDGLARRWEVLYRLVGEEEYQVFQEHLPTLGNTPPRAVCLPTFSSDSRTRGRRSSRRRPEH